MRSMGSFGRLAAAINSNCLAIEAASGVNNTFQRVANQTHANINQRKPLRCGWWVPGENHLADPHWVIDGRRVRLPSLALMVLWEAPSTNSQTILLLKAGAWESPSQPHTCNLSNSAAAGAACSNGTRPPCMDQMCSHHWRGKSALKLAGGPTMAPAPSCQPILSLQNQRTNSASPPTSKAGKGECLGATVRWQKNCHLTLWPQWPYKPPADHSTTSQHLVIAANHQSAIHGRRAAFHNNLCKGRPKEGLAFFNRCHTRTTSPMPCNEKELHGCR